MAVTKGTYIQAHNLRAEIEPEVVVGAPKPPETLIRLSLTLSPQIMTVEEWEQFVERVSHAIGQIK